MQLRRYGYRSSDPRIRSRAPMLVLTCADIGADTTGIAKRLRSKSVLSSTAQSARKVGWQTILEEGFDLFESQFWIAKMINV